MMRDSGSTEGLVPETASSGLSPQSRPTSLLGPGDPPPFRVINPEGQAHTLLVCDHASNRVPAALDNLGLDDVSLGHHVGWDIGAAKVTEIVAHMLDAPAVLAGYSRLVIDVNRYPDTPDSILEVSDGVIVPGNRNLSEAEKAQRRLSLFVPYHREIERILRRFRERSIVPALISIHSFTPALMVGGESRPWHVGVLYDNDERIAQRLLPELLKIDGIAAGDNLPYSGRHPHDFTVDNHAEMAGLPCIGIELRQDLLSNDDDIRRWAESLGHALARALDDEQLRTVRQGLGVPES